MLSFWVEDLGALPQTPLKELFGKSSLRIFKNFQSVFALGGASDFWGADEGETGERNHVTHPFAYLLFSSAVSSRMVTGPSLRRETSIWAPNTPVSTCGTVFFACAVKYS